MGAPKPWPTRWPEPEKIPPYEDEDDYDDPLEDPGYGVETDPLETPFHLPEERLSLYSVTWGVTQTCNLHCDHCYDAVGGRRADLTTEQALDVVDRLADLGISFIAFSGGEPMLRPDLFQLMARCRTLGIDIALRSNVTVITHAEAERLAAMDVRVVGVSLDGATPATHDSVRGPGAYHKTRRGVEALLAAGIRVNLEVVLRQRNVHQRLQFIALAEAWGVDELNFAMLAPRGRAAQLQDEMLSDALRKNVTAELYHASKTTTVAMTPSCTLAGDCWACIEPNITCDGWVTPCYLSPHKLFHILETEPEEMKAILQQHRLWTMHACRQRCSAPPTTVLEFSVLAQVAR